MPQQKCPAFPATQYQRAARVFAQMHRMRRMWQMFAPAPPLNRGDLIFLGAIAHHSEGGKRQVTVSSLAREVKQSPSAISQKLRVLEKQGYVRRKENPADRRVARIVLTPKGAETAQASLNEFLGRLELALDEIGAENVDTLLRLLELFTTQLNKATKPTDEPDSFSHANTAKKPE